ncbi:MAG TPA: cellulase N-terminal Ig-like domain-containing protein [Bacteroidales bacterium]|nr:cellulase N-terminal Ig-like domain-containing protein [Bacteroidales bacterium]
MVAYSQTGYHPDQKKIAVIELDKNDRQLPSAKLLKVLEDGSFLESYSGNTVNRGKYLRYNYCSFDFSSVTDSGLYIIRYGETSSLPFRIAREVYTNAWQPALDVFSPSADGSYVCKRSIQGLAWSISSG